ncbi:hypothetical protein [Streptomyces sp. NPDC096033]|uniref:hypothetical protein n=1 Tax=Streptomyces sp. NPDC096033 TaxID=3366071 RepID=UPI0037F9F253
MRERGLTGWTVVAGKGGETLAYRAQRDIRGRYDRPVTFYYVITLDGRHLDKGFKSTGAVTKWVRENPEEIAAVVEEQPEEISTPEFNLPGDYAMSAIRKDANASGFSVTVWATGATAPGEARWVWAAAYDTERAPEGATGEPVMTVLAESYLASMIPQAEAQRAERCPAVPAAVQVLLDKTFGVGLRLVCECEGCLPVQLAPVCNPATGAAYKMLASIAPMVIERMLAERGYVLAGELRGTIVLTSSGNKTAWQAPVTPIDGGRDGGGNQEPEPAPEAPTGPVAAQDTSEHVTTVTELDGHFIPSCSCGWVQDNGGLNTREFAEMRAGNHRSQPEFDMEPQRGPQTRDIAGTEFTAKWERHQYVIRWYGHALQVGKTAGEAFRRLEGGLTDKPESYAAEMAEAEAKGRKRPQKGVKAPRKAAPVEVAPVVAKDPERTPAERTEYVLGLPPLGRGKPAGATVKAGTNKGEWRSGGRTFKVSKNPSQTEDFWGERLPFVVHDMNSGQECAPYIGQARTEAEAKRLIRVYVAELGLDKAAPKAKAAPAPVVEESAAEEKQARRERPWEFPLDAKGRALQVGDLVTQAYAETITPYRVERLIKNGSMSVDAVAVGEDGGKGRLREHCNSVVRVTEEQMAALPAAYPVEANGHRGWIRPSNPVMKPGKVRATCVCMSHMEISQEGHSRKAAWFTTMEEAEAAWRRHAAAEPYVEGDDEHDEHEWNAEEAPEVTQGYAVVRVNPLGEKTDGTEGMWWSTCGGGREACYEYGHIVSPDSDTSFRETEEAARALGEWHLNGEEGPAPTDRFPGQAEASRVVWASFSYEFVYRAECTVSGCGAEHVFKGGKGTAKTAADKRRAVRGAAVAWTAEHAQEHAAAEDAAATERQVESNRAEVSEEGPAGESVEVATDIEDPAALEPVAVFIVSAKSNPTRRRVLWAMTREDAMKLCSDDRTSSDRYMLCWTAPKHLGTLGEDWAWHQDRGTTAAVIDELGVTILDRAILEQAAAKENPRGDWGFLDGESIGDYRGGWHGEYEIHTPYGLYTYALRDLGQSKRGTANNGWRYSLRCYVDGGRVGTDDVSPFKAVPYPADVMPAIRKHAAKQAAKANIPTPEEQPASPATPEIPSAEALADERHELWHQGRNRCNHAYPCGRDAIAAQETDEQREARIFLELKAEQTLPDLRWSQLMTEAVEWAADGDLYRDGKKFITTRGRPVKADRVRLLAGAGFLTLPKEEGGQVKVTADGAEVLAMAKAYPAGLLDDAEAMKLVKAAQRKEDHGKGSMWERNGLPILMGGQTHKLAEAAFWDAVDPKGKTKPVEERYRKEEAAQTPANIETAPNSPAGGPTLHHPGEKVTVDGKDAVVREVDGIEGKARVRWDNGDPAAGTKVVALADLKPRVTVVGNGGGIIVTPADVFTPVAAPAATRQAVRPVQLDMNGYRWGVECDRHGGAPYLVRTDLESKEDAEGFARLHALDHTDPERVLTPEELDQAEALAFSDAQLEVMSWAKRGDLTEDASGFYVPDGGNWKPRQFKAARVLVLLAAGLLEATDTDHGRRDIRLTSDGEAAWTLWDRARRQGAVTIAADDNTFGITAKQRSEYHRLTPAAGESVEVVATDIDPLDMWEDEGGYVPGVETPKALTVICGAAAVFMPKVPRSVERIYREIAHQTTEQERRAIWKMTGEGIQQERTRQREALPQPAAPAILAGETIEPMNPTWGQAWWIFRDQYGYSFEVQERRDCWHGMQRLDEKPTATGANIPGNLATVANGGCDTAEELLNLCREIGQQRATQDAGGRMVRRVLADYATPVPLVICTADTTPAMPEPVVEVRGWFTAKVAPEPVVEEDGPDYAAISRTNHAAAVAEPVVEEHQDDAPAMDWHSLTAELAELRTETRGGRAFDWADVARELAALRELTAEGREEASAAAAPETTWDDVERELVELREDVTTPATQPVKRVVIPARLARESMTLAASAALVTVAAASVADTGRVLLGA